jgi:hypothetical protein
MSSTKMFKIPAFDPFSIVLMGAGILLAVLIPHTVSLALSRC